MYGGVSDLLSFMWSMLSSWLFLGRIVVLIFIDVRALAGSCARKKRQALPDLLKGLNLTETFVMNFVIIAVVGNTELELWSVIERLIEKPSRMLHTRSKIFYMIILARYIVCD